MSSKKRSTERIPDNKSDAPTVENHSDEIAAIEAAIAEIGSGVDTMANSRLTVVVAKTLVSILKER